MRLPGFSRANFWMLWMCHRIPFLWYSIFLFFCLEEQKKEHLDESNFCHSYGNYFETTVLKVTWYQFFKDLSSQLPGTLSRYFKDTIQLMILETWISIRANYFLSIKPIWHGSGGFLASLYQLNHNKFFLNRFSQLGFILFS